MNLRARAMFLAATVVLCGAFTAVRSLALPKAKQGVTENDGTARPTAEWKDPLAYFDEITSLFGQRLKDYGVDNLPVPDRSQYVKATRYNVPLVGTVNYTNGFVSNIKSISRYYRQFMWYFDNREQAVMHYKILLEDVVVVYDLRADLEVEKLTGTAELTFPENLVEVYLNYNLTSKEVSVTSMKTNAVAGPKTVFNPDSAVMRAVAYNSRLTMANSLFTDLTPWIDNSIRTLFEMVVLEVPYPVKYAETSRRRGKHS